LFSCCSNNTIPSLLVLQAAMFNFTEITFILMDAGANVQAKNSQGESSVLSLQLIDLRRNLLDEVAVMWYRSSQILRRY
jgi:hypothetical protein